MDKDQTETDQNKTLKWTYRLDKLPLQYHQTNPGFYFKEYHQKWFDENITGEIRFSYYTEVFTREKRYVRVDFENRDDYRKFATFIEGRWLLEKLSKQYCRSLGQKLGKMIPKEFWYKYSLRYVDVERNPKNMIDGLPKPIKLWLDDNLIGSVDFSFLAPDSKGVEYLSSIFFQRKRDFIAFTLFMGPGRPE